MRIKRRSAKTRRLTERRTSSSSESNLSQHLIEDESVGKLSAIESLSSASSDNDDVFLPTRRAFPISSSQIAGPSHAGPIIIQESVLDIQGHPFNSDCDTQIISGSSESDDLFIPLERVPVNDIEHPYNSDCETEIIRSFPHNENLICARENYQANWIKIGKDFDKIMSNINWNSCSNEVCSQKFPDLFLNTDGQCRLCTNKSTAGEFNSLNGLEPGEVPSVLSELTPIEEMLIARIHPVVCFYRIRGQRVAYSGHVIHFRQDVVTLFNKLPVDPQSSQVIAVITRTTPSGIANLRVRSNKVRDALIWLKRNHRKYHDIEIDEDLLATLPIDGDINLTIIGNTPANACPEENEHDNIIHESHFPCIPQLDQANAISAALNEEISWPVLQNTPINEFTTEGYLTQAFPILFPYGVADLIEPRPTKVDYLNYFQYLMRYKDGRFAKHPRFRFVAFDTIMRWQAIKTGNIFVQRNALGNVLARDLETMLQNNPSLNSKVMYSVGKLRASQSFWSQCCGELLDMVQQLGTPTIFFTLSAADYHWPDLFRLLTPNTNIEQLSERDRVTLMHENPLLTSWFFRRRAETFINKVSRKVYSVKDFWYRYEWQWRGSPHIHGVLWIDNAPDISNLDSLSGIDRENIASWFSEFNSAWNFEQNLPQPSVHPSRHRFSEKLDDESDLNSLLNCLQRRTRCGRHCLRQDRRTKLIKCRYGFPKEMCERDMLVKENDNWVFKPRRNDDKMARYNSFVTQVWRGNTDFSPITSKEAVLNYIARYATKSEKASVVHKETLADLVANAADSTRTKTLISKLMIASTAERDFSTQEICHIRMSWPLFHASRSFVNVIIRDDNWVNILHSNNENTAIIERYKNRPNSLDNLSLFNFAAHYRFSLGSCIPRSNKAVVRIFPRLKLDSTIAESENYYKLMATAYIPWRSTPDTLIENVISETPWFAISENIPNEAPEDMRLEYPLPDDLFEEDIPIDPLREQRDPVQAISRVAPVEHEIRSLGTREIDEEFDWEQTAVSESEKNQLDSWLEGVKSNYHIAEHRIDRASTLSADQLKIMTLCRRQINAFKEKSIMRVKRTMVQGKAGSGKSFLIQQIANEFKLAFDENSVAILAPTGAAAVNINGKTIHSFLRISVSEHKPLDGIALRKFQMKMSEIKVLIFDEMSMIGLTLLHKISTRLQEGAGSCEEAFGGYIVYFFGDMQQLPPVKDIAWYSETEKAMSSRGKLVAQSIERYYLLTSSHRQAGNDQRAFRDVLDGVAVGQITNSMYELLISRRSAALSREECNSFSDAVHIFPTKELVARHNQEFLGNTGNPVAKIVAEHNIPQGFNASEDQAQGLVAELFLSVGCKVMLRSNLWTECGLVNGAIGVVRRICYKEGERPPSLPVVVLVEFERCTGPYFIDRCVPITPLKRQWKVGDKTLTRRQFPLIVAHAITAHKSQGLTLDKAVVDIGLKEMTLGLSYVALSRVKTVSGLMLLHTFEKSRIDSIAKSKIIAERTSFLRKFR